MWMIIFCTSVPTTNCWHKTVQQLFNHKAAHWSEITNWSDCILAVTCCNRHGTGTNLFAAAHTERLWPCDEGDDRPSPWRREPQWTPSALRSSPRGTAPASAQHTGFLMLLILSSYYNPTASLCLLLTLVSFIVECGWSKKKKKQQNVHLCVVWGNQSHITHRVPIQIWDTENRQCALKAGRPRLLPPDFTYAKILHRNKFKCMDQASRATPKAHCITRHWPEDLSRAESWLEWDSRQSQFLLESFSNPHWAQWNSGCSGRSHRVSPSVPSKANINTQGDGNPGKHVCIGGQTHTTSRRGRAHFLSNNRQKCHTCISARVVQSALRVPEDEEDVHHLVFTCILNR